MRLNQIPPVVLSAMTMAAALLVSCGPAFSQAIVGGVVSDGPATAIPPSGPVTPTAIVSINFDIGSQPCLFLETIALRDKYLAQGVQFSGPGVLDGGAILDRCSNFGITGYSPPNFLAFNLDAVMKDGGHPVGPERFTFTNPVSSVGMLVGSNQGGTATLSAYSSAASLLGTVQMGLGFTMKSMKIDVPGIAYAELSVVDQQEGLYHGWIVDNLGFDLGPVPVAATTWGQVKSIYR